MLITHQMGEWEDELIAQGFTYYRQHFMFGDYLGYKKDDELRFIDFHGIWTPEKLYEHLMDVWCPVSRKEREYFARIKKEGKLL